MQLTVAMITMNEEAAIAKVVADIRAAAPAAEILVVDSSKDRTPEIAAELGCRVVRQFPPRGFGPAMDRALREAKGDVVLTLDCDDTYPAAAIPDFVAAIEAGADLVDGNRIWRRLPAMPLSNFVANRAFGVVARLACRSRSMDLHSGMRAYRKSMLDALRWDPNGGERLPVELVPLAAAPRVQSGAPCRSTTRSASAKHRRCNQVGQHRCGRCGASGQARPAAPEVAG